MIVAKKNRRVTIKIIHVMKNKGQQILPGSKKKNDISNNSQTHNTF